MRAMIHRWHLLYYEHVPLWLWPAVFWQLWEIDRWSAHFQRCVFVEVEPDGKVYSVWWEGMHDTWDDETHEKLNWSPGDLDKYLPGFLSTALSPVHGQAQPDRNPLRPPCAKRLAGVQTQTSVCEDRLALGTPPPVPIPDAPKETRASVFVTRPEALRASVSKRVPYRAFGAHINQVQDCSLYL